MIQIYLDMEMPKGCGGCIFSIPHKVNGYHCMLQKDKFGYAWTDYTNVTKKNCPLKEVEEKSERRQGMLELLDDGTLIITVNTDLYPKITRVLVESGKFGTMFYSDGDKQQIEKEFMGFDELTGMPIYSW